MNSQRNYTSLLQVSALIAALSSGCATTNPNAVEPTTGAATDAKTPAKAGQPPLAKYIKLRGGILAQSADGNEKLDVAIRTTANKSYGLPVTTEADFVKAFESLSNEKTPKALAQLMLRVYRLPYQIAREKFKGKGFPGRVFTPAEAFLPKGDKPLDEQGLKDVVAMINGWDRTIRQLVSAYDQGDYNKLLMSKGKDRAAIMVAVKAGDFLIKKLQINHILTPEVRPMVATGATNGDTRLTVTLMGVKSGRVYQRSGSNLKAGQTLQTLTAEQATSWIDQSVGKRKLVINPQYRNQQNAIAQSKDAKSPKVEKKAETPEKQEISANQAPTPVAGMKRTIAAVNSQQ